ncbi:MAG: hypothetical protein ACKVQR_04560 [Aquabacterium sp.]
MKSQTALRFLAAAFATVALAHGAQAALISRPGGMVYDSTRNITWLSDWKFGGSFNSGNSAASWAHDLVYGGFSDWSLPDIGLLTGLAGEVGDLTTVSQFTNVGPGAPGPYRNVYWSSTASPFICQFQVGPVCLIGGSRGNWALDPVSGAQVLVNGSSFFTPSVLSAFAVAVRPGDVIVDTPASVPEPQGLVLLALGAAVVARRVRPG